jgi:uncharacterized protein
MLAAVQYVKGCVLGMALKIGSCLKLSPLSKGDNLNMIHRREFLTGLCASAFASRAAFGSNLFSEPKPKALKLISAAESQIGLTVSYDPNYTQIAYPGGDVPIERGVCTDVVIRAYRQALAIDLQKLVHEDMKSNFSAYPRKWGLKRTDSNIDHRRVPNLQTFFARQNAGLPISTYAIDYIAGDITTMLLPGNLTHIALITHYANSDGTKPLCIHNIGGGAKLEDVLFAYPLTGHYRFQV